MFIGDGVMGLNPGDNAIRVAIIAWAWGKYLGDEGIERGIRAKISSFSRHFVNAKMTKGKTCGDYVNSILAKREALLDGYDEAIMLDTQGLVSEATGENIFIVRDGVIATPPLHTVLGGITRATVLELARDKGIPVEERAITRDELYIADEVFLTGTAAEVTPMREIDHRTIGAGARGPVAEGAPEGVLRRRLGPRPQVRALADLRLRPRRSEHQRRRSDARPMRGAAASLAGARSSPIEEMTALERE